MEWRTRTHWLWGLIVPGGWLFPLIGAALVSMPVFGARAIPLALPAIVLGFWRLSDVWWHWRSFSLSISRETYAVCERNGFVVVAERHIDLQFAGAVSFRQTPMGRMLDYGSLSVDSVGGPYEWTNIGNFRTLRRIIQTRGTWLPSPRVPISRVARNQLAVLVPRLDQFRVAIVGTEQRQEGRVPQSPIPHGQTPNYVRFMDFSQAILFGSWNSDDEIAALFGRVGGRMYTSVETRLYYRILRTRRVITSDTSGLMRRQKRIRTIEDVRRHVPPEWFRRAAATD